MKKITLFLVALMCCWQGFAQFGCGQAVALTNGYTSAGITTPGNGGPEDWNIDIPNFTIDGQSFNGRYWKDDVYLFQYSTGAVAEAMTFKITTRNGWTGVGVFGDCTGNTFSQPIVAKTSGSASGSATDIEVSAELDPNVTVYIAVGQWGTPNDLDFDVTEFTAQAITCSRPTNVVASNIASTQVELNWTSLGTATGFEIIYGVKGFDPLQNTPARTIVPDNDAIAGFTLTGLTGGLEYDVYVKQICGPGDESSLSDKLSFKTACEAIVPPYLQDFVSTPLCWNAAVTGTSFPGPYVTTNSNWYKGMYPTNSNIKTLSIELSSNSKNDWMVSPEFDLSGSVVYELSYLFAAKTSLQNSFNGMGSDDKIKVFITDDDGSTWSVLKTYGTDAAAGEVLPTYEGSEDVIELSAYLGSTVRIAFYATEGTVDDPESVAYYIANFQIRKAVNCTTPSNVTVTDVTGTTAQVNWTQGGTETEWEIVYGEAGFNPETEGMTQAVTTNPYTLTNLMPVKDYDLYVRAVCSPTEKSYLTLVAKFTTLCSAKVPNYAYYFDNVSTVRENCWDYAGAGTLAQGPDFSTSSGIRWNIRDYINASTGRKSASVNLYQKDNNYWLLSPQFEIPAATAGDHELSYLFGAKAFLQESFNGMGSDDKIKVLISADNGANWTALKTYGTDASAGEILPTYTGQEYTINLNAYAGQTVQFAFYATDGTVDDNEDVFYYMTAFKVRKVASCVEVQNIQVAEITNVSAKITWTAGGTEADWKVVYGIKDFDPQTDGTTVDINGTPEKVLTGLTADTEYDVYVKAVCGTEESQLSYMKRFKTQVSCPAVQNVVVDNITDASFDVTWTAGMSETQWQVAYGPQGFDPDGGTVTPVDVDTTPALSVSNLSATTVYDVYVRATCSASENSEWSPRQRITTRCAVSIPPYEQNFASANPDCWEKAKGGDDTTGPTTLGSGAWGFNQNFLDTSTGKKATSINLYQNTKKEWVISPRFDLTSGGPYELFYMFAAKNYYGSAFSGMGSDDKVQVLISTDNGASWTVLKTYGNNTTAGEIAPVYGITDYTIDLSSYSGQIVKFAIYATEGTVDDSEDYNIYFTDFTIQDLTTCPKVENIQIASIAQTSADVSWTQMGTETEWKVIYGPKDFDPQTEGTTIDDNDGILGVSITGLTPSTFYDVYVKAICSASDESELLKASFVTSCDTADVPYVVDFEDSDLPNLPRCTSQQNLGSGNEWRVVEGSGGNKELKYNFHSTQPANVWFYTKGVNLSAGQEYSISFEYKVKSSTFPEKLKVAYGTAADATAMTNELAVYDPMTNTSYEEASLNFTPAVDGVYYFGFKAFSEKNKYALFIDNIKVDVAPICEVPTAVSASNITSTTATISWTENGDSTSWEVKYGAQGFDVNTAGTLETINTTSEANLTGLTPETAYDVYVRAKCGGNNHTDWVQITFTTALPPCNAPTAVAVSAIEADQAKVTWTENGTATKWEIKYGAQGFDVMTEGTLKTQEGGIATTTLTSLTAETAYDVYVRSYCAANNQSEWSSVVSFTTIQAPCSEPTSVKTLNITAHTVDVMWDSTSSATSWKLIYGEQGFDVNTEGTTLVDNDGTPGITIENLQANTNYDLYIQSICGGGQESTVFGPISFTTDIVSVKASHITNLSYYPNPVTDIVNISAGEAILHINIFDILGKEIRRMDTNDTNIKVDLHDVSAGIYFIKIETQDAVKMIRVIKQ